MLVGWKQPKSSRKASSGRMPRNLRNSKPQRGKGGKKKRVSKVGTKLGKQATKIRNIVGPGKAVRRAWAGKMPIGWSNIGKKGKNLGRKRPILQPLGKTGKKKKKKKEKEKRRRLYKKQNCLHEGTSM